MLVTLKDAADYITKLPKKESDLPECQAAIERRHVERVFNPDRKETNWGKRKLKRDQ
jgi:hypothetical protein